MRNQEIGEKEKWNKSSYPEIIVKSGEKWEIDKRMRD